jgi:hypothetical protein
MYAALGTIGTPGPPVAGPYNPNHMNRPKALTIAGEGRLWVAEYDMAPKRISIWNTNGLLAKALYGPPKYGGDGRLDPLDNTRFYNGDYDDDSTVPIPYHIGMEYKLDWTAVSNLTTSSSTTTIYLPINPSEPTCFFRAAQAP